MTLKEVKDKIIEMVVLQNAHILYFIVLVEGVKKAKEKKHSVSQTSRKSQDTGISSYGRTSGITNRNSIKLC